MGSDVVQPDAFKHRSCVYRELQGLGARFGEVAGAAVAMTYGDEHLETEQARHLALADLSPLPRSGYKGPGVIDWLSEQGLDVPSESNRALSQTNGSVAARLSPSEMFVLDDLACESNTVGRLRDAWRNKEKTPDSTLAFMAPRQDSHAWFGLTGAQGAAMLAKLCAVDLRARVFDNGAVAQTSVARLGAIIIRRDLGTTLHYHVLADSAAAGYLWECLLDAMNEFNGKPVGLTALRRLDESTS